MCHKYCTFADGECDLKNGGEKAEQRPLHAIFSLRMNKEKAATCTHINSTKFYEKYPCNPALRLPGSHFIPVGVFWAISPPPELPEITLGRG